MPKSMNIRVKKSYCIKQKDTIGTNSILGTVLFFTGLVSTSFLLDAYIALSSLVHFLIRPRFIELSAVT